LRRSGRDDQRTVIKRNSYTPFGETFAPTVIDGAGYTGHVMDQATGLTYMQQRYYDPQIGRLISIDPVGTDPNTGTVFNRYSYAANNPYRFTDPDGRQIQAPLGESIGGRTHECRGWGCRYALEAGATSGGANPTPSTLGTVTVVGIRGGGDGGGGSDQVERRPYWSRVRENVALTNTIPLKLGTGLITSGFVSRGLNLPTPFQALVGSAEAGYLTTEVGWAALHWGINTLVVTVAWEVGATAGSIVNQASIPGTGQTVEELLIPVTENNVDFFHDRWNDASDLFH
jgi:RHS repeat-associated protein